MQFIQIKVQNFLRLKKIKTNIILKCFTKNQTHRGSGIVDRRVRWFRELVEKYFTTNNTLNWIDVYQQINTNMNNTINRNIKQKPKDIWDRKVESQQIIKNNNPIDKFKVGNFVRVKNINDKFTKNSTGLFSEKVYKIKEIDGLGMLVDGITRKLFPVDVKKVKGNNENTGDLRTKIKKQTELKK